MIDWDEILDAHGPAVWKTVYRLVGNHADAADCFQEAFVSALAYARSHEIDNWAGLLKRTATARALDRLRAHSRNSYPRASGDVAGEVPDNGRPPPEIAADNELLARLRAALADLPSPQAEACCLRFLEGRRYDEIAKALDVTVNHVGVLLTRAKATLRVRLAAFAPASSSRDRKESAS